MNIKAFGLKYYSPKVIRGVPVELSRLREAKKQEYKNVGIVPTRI